MSLRPLPYLLILLTLSSLQARAQDMVRSTASAIRFFSDTPVYDIEAKNAKAQAIVKHSTKQVSMRIPVKQFVFENKLMEEHFNEDYLETEKHPTCTFEGKFAEALKEGSPAVAKGILELHGVKREVELKGTWTKVGESHVLKGKTQIKLTDYKIQVPELVFDKIAEVVDVDAEFTFQAMR